MHKAYIAKNLCEKKHTEKISAWANVILNNNWPKLLKQKKKSNTSEKSSLEKQIFKKNCRNVFHSF